MKNIIPILIGGVAVAGAGYFVLGTDKGQEIKESITSGAVLGNLNTQFKEVGNTILERTTTVFEKSTEYIIETGSDLKDTVVDAGAGLKDAVDKGIDGVSSTFSGLIPDLPSMPELPSISKIIDNIPTPAKAGIDWKKAGMVTAGGWGAVGVASGTAPPLAPFIALAGADIWAFTKLREKTIEKTGKRPEEIVTGWFKNLNPFDNKVSNKKSTSSNSSGVSAPYRSPQSVNPKATPSLPSIKPVFAPVGLKSLGLGIK